MKKKKILILFMLTIFLCGCTKINDTSINNIAENIINSKYNLKNKFMKGYKYYLPIGTKSKKVDDYNQIFKSDNTTYFMYVDIISFYNKIDTVYDNLEGYDNYILKDGAIRVKKDINTSYVKIEYNYASVEFVCPNDSLKKSISKALIVLTSIEYNEDAIKTLINDKSFNGEKEIIDIFGKKDQSTVDYLDYDETYDGNEDVDYDPDVIN